MAFEISLGFGRPWVKESLLPLDPMDLTNGKFEDPQSGFNILLLDPLKVLYSRNGIFWGVTGEKWRDERRKK